MFFVFKEFLLFLGEFFYLLRFFKQSLYFYKKVYFAGSIRGGRVDAGLYQRMIAYIQKTDVVLTEHVGHPELNLLEQGRNKDGQIYDQDTGWLRESDLLIAECTCPSLGVGYELAMAYYAT